MESMYNSIHSKFIKTPIFYILKDGVNACLPVGCNMETYPLCDYVVQSLFLKMTGAQEQKLKCICWDMATNNYEYRRVYLDKVKTDYGEFSSYNQKNNVYKQLINEINRYDKDFRIETIKWLKNIDSEKENELFAQEIRMMVAMIIKEQSKNGRPNEKIKNQIEINIENKFRKKKNIIVAEAIKKKFLTKIKDRMIALMESSILSIGDRSNYLFWKTNIINAKDCASEDNLLAGDLKTRYENDLIRHRHRCAHNLTSYQQNLPTLSALAENEHRYHNYFFRFTTLILIDEIFMLLYNEYIKQIECNISHI